MNTGQPTESTSICFVTCYRVLKNPATLIRPQSSVTSLYGHFSALNLPYKEVTEFLDVIECCKASENPYKL